MFYEVRISDADGNLKRKISGAELSEAFWKKIFAEEERRNSNNGSYRLYQSCGFAK